MTGRSYPPPVFLAEFLVTERPPVECITAPEKVFLYRLAFCVLVKDQHPPDGTIRKDLVLYRIEKDCHNDGNQERIFLYLRQLKDDKIPVLHIVLQWGRLAHVLIKIPPAINSEHTCRKLSISKYSGRIFKRSYSFFPSLWTYL